MWSIIEPGVYLMAATVPTLRPLLRQLFMQNPRVPSRCVTPAVRSNTFGTAGTETKNERPRLTKKASEKEFINTIGCQPTRTVRLDEYHHIWYGQGVTSVRSEDEESVICADAIIRENTARRGRATREEGALRAWTLQPIQISPMRTSFFLEE